jgi:hypothetical protein
MFKRVVWFGVGAAAGTVGTVWAEHKVRSQIDRARPVNVVDSARRAVRIALDEGRTAAREREIELRERYLSRGDLGRPQ